MTEEFIDQVRVNVSFDFRIKTIPKPKWQYKRLKELGIKTKKTTSYKVIIYKDENKETKKVYTSHHTFHYKEEAFEHVRKLKKQIRHNKNRLQVTR